MKVITKMALVTMLKKHGYTGPTGKDDLSQVKSYLDSRGISGLAVGHTDDDVIDLDASWKKVTIAVSKDDEEVEVVDNTATPPAPEGASMDEDEDEVIPKSTRPTAASMLKSMGGGGRGPAVHGSDSFTAGRKRYAAKAARHETLFSDPEVAEVWGAYLRSSGAGLAEYGQKRADRAILKAAHVTYDNSLGGVLMPDGFIAELIELKPQFGAGARLSGITPMSAPKEEQPRLLDDVVMNYTSEGAASGETNAGFDSITVVSHEITGHVPVSIRLINNAAIEIADILSRSFLRATGRKQDTAYFNGDSKQQGILTKLGSNSITEISGLTSTGLNGITSDHIQAFTALAPSWTDAYRDSLAYTMTRQVYQQTLQRFEINASGNTKADVRAGSPLRANADAEYNGYPVIFNNTMPKAYSNGAVVMLFGAFRESVRFGVLEGSQFMRSSEHVQFLNRNVVFQGGEEFAVNPHEVSNLAGEDGDVTKSGVVGLSVNN